MTEGQYISPFFYIGIFIFILPVILNLFNLPNFGFLFKVGIGCIVIGAIHTIFKRR